MRWTLGRWTLGWRWTVERFRSALVVLAIALTIVIVAAFAYARWQVRRIARDLPARLGIQIQQSTEGFTYSKTEQGRTVFTLHAARALQYRAGGHAILHDVRIQVFNSQDGLADTIAGQQFEYDPHEGIVRSIDEAHIDLHAPADHAALSAATKSSNQQAATPDRMIHVVMHGLIFNQKTDMATTDGLLVFQLPQGDGQAVGTVYDGKVGQLLLKSKVVIHAQTQRGIAVIHAAQALYDQHASQVQLENATYVTATEHASAQQATILLRPDNSIENVHAQQQVRYRTARGESVSAQSMIAALDDHSRAQAAHFAGDVQMDWQQQQEHTHSSAAEGQLYFNAQGRLRQAILDRNVRVQQRILTAAAPLDRTLRANHLVMNFVAGRTGNVELQQAVATGDATLHQQALAGTQAASIPAQKNDIRDTTLQAQKLTAQFAQGSQLQRVDGEGNTQLQSVKQNGDVDTSFGNTLQVLFGATPPKQKKKNLSGTALALDTSNIQSAVQRGHVVLRQIVAATSVKNEQSESSTATADQAEYQAASQVLALTGNPHFEDENMEMVAQQMQMNRASGEVTATGSVQTTLRGGATIDGLLHGDEAPSSTNAATHIIADQAVLQQKTQKVIFTGHARLWQAASVIEAPVIQILQGQQSLQAYGENKDSGVRCTFVASSTASVQSQHAPTSVEVTSARLLYSDAERRAHFTGQVVLTMQEDQLHSDTADIYLQSSTPAHTVDKNLQSTQTHSPPNSPQSSVERMVAQGNVRLTQPGRYGTGAQIVYTASDGRFVLTGTEQSPPLLVDSVQGSLTGKAVIFSSEQNVVQVQGGNAATTTETRVQK